MNFKPFVYGLLACSLLAAGCASRSDDSSDEDLAAESDALHSKVYDTLKGAYVGGPSIELAGLRHFEGLVLTKEPADGYGYKFWADVDTGIVCVMAPCPTHERIEGRWLAGSSYLFLLKAKGQQPGVADEFFGAYRYTASGSDLSLTHLRTKDGHQLVKRDSYCKEASDCDDQGIIHPMGVGIQCVGHFTCGQDRTCGYTCENPNPPVGTPCGPTVCAPGQTCCNSLSGICTAPGEFCAFNL